MAISPAHHAQHVFKPSPQAVRSSRSWGEVESYTCFVPRVRHTQCVKQSDISIPTFRSFDTLKQLSISNPATNMSPARNTLAPDLESYSAIVTQKFSLLWVSSNASDASSSSPIAVLEDRELSRPPSSLFTPSGTETSALNDDSFSPMLKKYAYVTLLTRDSYLPGVQALQRSLLAVGSLHSLIVMITPDTVSDRAVDVLESEGCVVRAIERYVPGGRIDHGNYKLACYAECWCKLRMWEMTEFERLVYLDADMLVLRNIEDLFALPEGFWAAPDCAAGRPTQQERDGCGLLAVCKGLRPTYFNAGLYVMSPCMDTMEDFGMALQEGRFEIGGYAEQDFLNAYYKNSWRCLSAAYNLQKGIKCHHPDLWKPEEAAILHFTDRKPWCADGTHAEDQEHEDIVKLWWRAFKNGSIRSETYVSQTIKAAPHVDGHRWMEMHRKVF